MRMPDLLRFMWLKSLPAFRFLHARRGHGVAVYGAYSSTTLLLSMSITTYKDIKTIPELDHSTDLDTK